MQLTYCKGYRNQKILLRYAQSFFEFFNIISNLSTFNVVDALRMLPDSINRSALRATFLWIL